MSGYEMRDMTGTLFREAEKSKESSPDFTGKVMVRGETLRIAGWLKQSKGGKAYISLAVSEPRPAQQDPAPAPAPAPKSKDFDIPF